jgi:hypothetical protein
VDAPIGAARLLDAWEVGWQRTPLEQGLAMLAADPRADPGALAQLTIGARERALFALRAALFGTAVEAVSACPRCGTDVEVAFDQTDLSGTDEQPPDSVTVGGVRYRLPTSADVATVLDGPPDEAPAALVRRCAGPGSGVSEPGVDAVVAAWAAADPVLDVTLRLGCPECGHEWAEPFDIVSYLWSELDGWCRRTVLEVHDLARAYGWAEPQVLALSSWRRRCYLGLVGS